MNKDGIKTFLKDTRVQELDLLRSLAITLVVTTHYFFNWLPGGSVGVSIFFCLSGYLVTKSLVQKDTSTNKFLIRRIFRIYPAYLFVCLLHLFLLYFFQSIYFPDYLKNLPKILLFIGMPQVWLGFGTGIFWTLQVELWFYLLIPYFIKNRNFHSALMFVIVFIIVSFLLKFLVLFDIIQLFPNSIFRTLYWMDNLLYGTLVALVLKNYNNQKLPCTTRLYYWIINLFILILFISIIAIALYWPYAKNRWPFQSSIVSLLTGIIIFYSQRYDLFKFKMPSIITYISLLAYSIYLIHPFPLDYYGAFKQKLNISTIDYKIFVFTTLIVLILLLHYLIEKPGIRFGKWLNNKYSKS